MLDLTVRLTDGVDWAKVVSDLELRIASSTLPAEIRTHLSDEAHQLVETLAKQGECVSRVGGTLAAERILEGSGYRIRVRADFSSSAGGLKGWLRRLRG
jgi:hypothetical protein